MNELIRTYKNEQNEPLVNGRELHEFLEVGTTYTRWFERMTEYGFAENVDFTVIAKNVHDDTAFGGTRKITDHAMKLDMAKEISMIQRTDKGKQARQYFIEVEKQFKQNYQPMSIEQMMIHQLQEMEQVKNDVALLKEETAISSSQRRKLQGKVLSTVIQVLGGKHSNAYKNKRINRTAFSNCYSELKKVFDVSSYADIPKVRFEEALALIPNWHPSLELRTRIEEANGTSQLWEEEQ